ncbi:MAG: hypothetical protein ACAH88_00205 [Roseimicrobium sp.]
MQYRPSSTLAWLASVVSLAAIASVLLYLWENDSNHTGFEPWLLSIVFAPTAIIGVLSLVRDNPRLAALSASCLGIGGLVFLFYLDWFNVLVQYDRLAERGGL